MTRSQLLYAQLRAVKGQLFLTVDMLVAKEGRGRKRSAREFECWGTLDPDFLQPAVQLYDRIQLYEALINISEYCTGCERHTASSDQRRY